MSTLRPPLIIIFAVTIGSLISACSDKSSAYQDRSLNLVEPVEIASWASFADGGSIEITFKDSLGKTLVFYYDLSGEGSKKNRYIYIGKKDHENAKRVPIGSAVEREIVKYVSKWMESNYPDFRKDPNKIYMDPDGKLITCGAILGLIRDLQRRNP